MLTRRARYLLYVYFLDFNRMVGHRDVYRNVAIKSKKFIARSGWLKICYVDFVMWMKKLFFSLALLCSGWVQAQTAWPLVQSTMYPYIDQMKLVRHEQTVLLGEGNQQTGRPLVKHRFTNLVVK